MQYCTIFAIIIVLVVTSAVKVATATGNLPLLSEPQSPVGPPYPVTASWFKDRFTHQEWDDTLTDFQKQGGDTVVLRAPPVLVRTKTDLQQDPNFRWCSGNISSIKTDKSYCWDQAEQELKFMGLRVAAFLTYQYEEAFSDVIMQCPKVDRKISSTHIYYRIVLPTNRTAQKMKSQCDFPPGSDVVVLFTSFAGTDPHQLLVETSNKLNHMSVFFGLPKGPQNFEQQLMPAYFAWVERILEEHKSRYSQSKRGKLVAHKRSLYDSIAGYYSSDDSSLPQLSHNSMSLYKKLGTMVKSHGKRFAISPQININRFQLNCTLQQHVQGFENLVRLGVIDILMVQEGRGSGKGSYYWPHQLHQPVHVIDPVLDKVIHYLHPTAPTNVTFAQTFSASNQDIFHALRNSQLQLQNNESIKFDFWLSVDAFEMLQDDPCLPVDPMNSGMGKTLNRASKSRVDWGLSVAGGLVQKVISFAWDSDYICTTKQYNTSLKEEILSDLHRPIITDCFFHNPHNLSVVLLGFNLEGETQAFTVDWSVTGGRSRPTYVYGYYFELDYGASNHLVQSLQYVMLYDIQEMVTTLTPKGTVHVMAQGARNDCYFNYDFA